MINKAVSPSSKVADLKKGSSKSKIPSITVSRSSSSNQIPSKAPGIALTTPGNMVTRLLAPGAETRTHLRAAASSRSSPAATSTERRSKTTGWIPATKVPGTNALLPPTPCLVTPATPAEPKLRVDYPHTTDARPATLPAPSRSPSPIEKAIARCHACFSLLQTRYFLEYQISPTPSQKLSIDRRFERDGLRILLNYRREVKDPLWLDMGERIVADLIYRASTTPAQYAGPKPWATGKNPCKGKGKGKAQAPTPSIHDNHRALIAELSLIHTSHSSLLREHVTDTLLSILRLGVKVDDQIIDFYEGWEELKGFELLASTADEFLDEYCTFVGGQDGAAKTLNEEFREVGLDSDGESFTEEEWDRASDVTVVDGEVRREERHDSVVDFVAGPGSTERGEGVERKVRNFSRPFGREGKAVEQEPVGTERCGDNGVVLF